MKRLIALLGLFFICILDANIVNQAILHTPDGTQITLLGEMHNETSELDQKQLISLKDSLDKWDTRNHGLHVMIEEPSKWTKSQQAYPTVASRLRSQFGYTKRKRSKLKEKFDFPYDNAINIENAEVRCASVGALYILKDDNIHLRDSGKFDAKKPFKSRRLSAWYSVKALSLQNVYDEFNHTLHKIKKFKKIPFIEQKIKDFYSDYQNQLTMPLVQIAQKMATDERWKLYSHIDYIANKLLENYLLVRAINKSKKSDVMIIAGAYHIGALRGMLQMNGCSMIEFEEFEDEAGEAIVLTQKQLSRWRTLYLKCLRYCSRFNRNVRKRLAILKKYYKKDIQK